MRCVLPRSRTLVIDNAPATDATRRVVDELRRTCVTSTNRSAVSTWPATARCATARGDVVAFVDDDAVPEPEWLDGLMPNFQSPRVVCVTGLTLPIALDTEAQELFEEHCTFVRGFRRRVFDGQIDNPLAVGPVGAGANMAVLREAALRLGGFDERLDGGRPTRSGGDHEMFTRMLRAGNRIVYDPAAVALASSPAHHGGTATDRLRLWRRRLCDVDRAPARSARARCAETGVVVVPPFAVAGPVAGGAQPEAGARAGPRRDPRMPARAAGLARRAHAQAKRSRA